MDSGINAKEQQRMHTPYYIHTQGYNENTYEDCF